MIRPKTIHGSALVLGERGILIRGRSGSGKSTLLRELLAADPQGTRMVADDRVIIAAVHGRLLADVPREIAGLVELRGVGVIKAPYVAPVVIHIVVDLAPPEAAPRMPEADEAVVTLEGITLPRLVLPVGYTGGAGSITAAAAIMTGQGEADCLLRCGIE